METGVDGTAPVLRILGLMVKDTKRKRGVFGMGRKNYRIASRDGIHRLHVVLWQPEGTVRAVVQISHGMVEMIERYEAFALYLNNRGIAVIGNDHLGHGQTAEKEEDLGYFCPQNMSATVVADLHRVTRFAKKKFPKVPYFLFGHSMGSFMARRYLITYGRELTGAVLCGTGSKPPEVLAAGTVVSNILRLILGDRFRSRLLKWNAFGMYQRRIPNPRTNSDWLTRESEIVDFCINNKYCNFIFTVNGYRTLFEVIGFIQRKENIARIPKQLPILLIAGEEDPVGDYGAGVLQVYMDYRHARIRDVRMRLYPEARHEILNEINRDVVYKDVLRWLERRIDFL